MNVLFDVRQLAQLASSFQQLCGIHASLRGADGHRVCEGGPRPALCALLEDASEDSSPCAGCRAWGGQRADSQGARILRCPAGLCVALLPIPGGEKREPLAWLCAGPFLDDSSVEAQWSAVRQALDGRADDERALRAAFLALRRLSEGEQAALSSMLDAVADSIRLRGLILPSGEGDLRRLERFLDEHYMEKLSLASVSAQLHIGRTRLCALAKRLSGGQTLFAMIAKRRIDAAKALLLQTDRPISAIAEAVGISDYNYFSKIFRASVGVSPSKFRKQARNDLDDLV